jgi:hypothetical protein
MKRQINKNFNNIPVIEPSAELFGKIILKIKEEKRISYAKKRLTIFSVILSVSSVLFFPVFKLTLSNIYSSGILQFVSLIFSDFETVSVYWKNYALSLLEIMPVMSMALFFGIVFAIFWSLRVATKDIKIICKPKLNHYGC